MGSVPMSHKSGNRRYVDDRSSACSLEFRLNLLQHWICDWMLLKNNTEIAALGPAGPACDRIRPVGLLRKLSGGVHPSLFQKSLETPAISMIFLVSWAETKVSHADAPISADYFDLLMGALPMEKNLLAQRVGKITEMDRKFS